MELPTFKEPQPLVEEINPQPFVEEITSSDEETESNFEDNTLEEDIENSVYDEDFEVFYRSNEPEGEELSPYPSTALVSEDQEAIKVLEGMVIEKRLPGLLSLLESHAGTSTPRSL